MMSRAFIAFIPPKHFSYSYFEIWLIYIYIELKKTIQEVGNGFISI